METIYFNFVFGASAIAVVLLAIGAILAVIRFRHPTSVLQIIGAAFLVMSELMSYLPLTHLEGRRITPTWVWQVEQGLMGGGIFLFALGYCWYWAIAKRKAHS